MKTSSIILAATLLLSPAVFAAGDPAKGKEMFVTCAGCHSLDNAQRRTAPSLASLFGKVTLRNGKRTTEESVREIVTQGYNRMPPFGYNFTREQMDDLMAYLVTLKAKPTETEVSPEAAAFNAYCLSCHNPALSGERGHVLRGLFQREKLASGEAVNEKNVRALIDAGHAKAPAFDTWVDEATRQKIVAFLKSY